MTDFEGNGHNFQLLLEHFDPLPNCSLIGTKLATVCIHKLVHHLHTHNAAGIDQVTGDLGFCLVYRCHIDKDVGIEEDGYRPSSS